MPTPRQHALDLLKWTRKISNDIIAGIPDDKYSWQPDPSANHPAWVLGHLAMTDVWIASLLDIKGAVVPEGWNKDAFGQGSKPVADPKVFPAPADLRKVFESNRAALLNWLEGATDAQLSVPLKEKTGGFANDPLDAMLKVVWHEGWHMGQVATCRKALGLPLVMG